VLLCIYGILRGLTAGHGKCENGSTAEYEHVLEYGKRCRQCAPLIAPA
jgi:hypothetical protein